MSALVFLGKCDVPPVLCRAMRLGQTPLSEMNILMELLGIQHLGQCDEQYHDVIAKPLRTNVDLIFTVLLDTWCLPMLVESAA